MTLNDLKRHLIEKPIAQHGLGAAVILLLTGALYASTIVPQSRDMQATERLRQQLTDQEHRHEQLRRARRHVELQLAQAMADVAQSPVAFDSPRAVNEQLARLSELAGWSGLTVETIDPGKATAGAMLTTQSIRVTGRGRFGACHTFMRVLREETPETSVKTFALAADAGDTGELRFEMELLWYSRPDGAAASAEVK